MKQIFILSAIKTAAFIAAGPLLFFSAACFPSYAHTKSESRYLSGTWEKDEHGWWFANQGNPEYYTSAWVEYRDNSYYLDASGYVATGWQYINSHWYYFNTYEGSTEGAMVRGWIQDTDQNGWFFTDMNGIMVTGWRKIDGYWYYFNPESDGTMGMMAVNRVVDDSYVDSDGRMNEIR